MNSPSMSSDPRLLRRQSISSRLSTAISSSEHGQADARQPPEIDKDIAEIQRYEDFTTIDWKQDAAREQARRVWRRSRAAGFYNGGQPSWRYRLWASYDAVQSWIVVTIVGANIGINAAFLNIVTEWLSDIKLGYCTTAFYLNENFCCWGEDNGCPHWRRWTGFEVSNFLVYLSFATVFAFVAASLVRSYAPYAAGSGISEIKCIIAGFIMKGFLGFWTLLIKSICLPLAIASGLSVGKEGPSVHYAVCTGNVISRLFSRYRSNASKMREVLCACAAAGVAVAFGSPIGGVLFSLEEMSNHFPLKTIWRSYFCALVATAVLAAMNPFRTGQLVMFQVKYDREWHFFEVVFYIIIGVFGGLYGAFVIKWNLRVQAFRKKSLSKYAVLEATLLAAGTSIIAYPNAFLRIDMTESMKILFLECEGAEDYHGLCEPDKRIRNITSLVVATVLRLLLVIISYGCKVPAGIFVPSMAIGASFGRTVGIIVQGIHEANPGSAFFSVCKPDEPCITPGTYAFLGAAAALCGIMHITVSVVVIMFELTGALTYILPTMIVVGVTKVVSGFFGRGGIADRMIWFNGFPYLDNKESDNFGVPVSEVMRNSVLSFPVSGMTLQEVEHMLSEDYQGFPIIENNESQILVGYIGRMELRYAIERLRREQRVSPNSLCDFSPPSVISPAPPATPMVTVHNDPLLSPTLDFSRYIDNTPITVHPEQPLEIVMEIFRKIGPRVILIVFQGQLTGLVTVKDCLKYQFKVEAAENSPEGHHVPEGQEQFSGMLSRARGWVSGKIFKATRGRVRLGGQHEDRIRHGGGPILDGDEELADEGIELESMR